MSRTRLTNMPSSQEVTSLVTEVRRLQEELPAVAAEARTSRNGGARLVRGGGRC